MGRRLIGPKVDFRIPQEVEDQIKEWADGDGTAHDALCRDLLIVGYNRERMRRDPQAYVRDLALKGAE
jgi:hypothetical protein